MRKTVSLLILGSLCLALGAEELRVSVEDSDLDIPLEGVALTLSATGFRTQTAETDADGKAAFDMPDGFAKGTIQTRLAGYADRRVAVKAGVGEIAISLSISETIEGKELVVERSTPGKSDEKPGISVVMEKRDIETTANIGLVEDVMTSIKTLPGVGFSGGWNAQPSIRGGYPEEMGTVLDDVYILSPWHWGGAWSIFNPMMVDSAKMSHGIFSARYGRAMSGLLEVSTIDPDPEQFRFDAGITSISTDFFAQIPVARGTGLFIGGKVTYMETLAWLNDGLHLTDIDISKTIPTMPFIRDFYAKGTFKPIPELDVSVNAFFGSDGIGVFSDETDKGIHSAMSFDWLYLQGFAATNVKWMVSDAAILKFSGGYNNNTTDADMHSEFSGSWDYSDEFIAKYDTTFDVTPDSMINGQTGYTIDSLDFDGFSRQTVEQLQGKIESEFAIGTAGMLCFGAEEVAQFAKSEQEITGWQIVSTLEPPEYRQITYENNLEGNRVLNSSAFALWSFGSDSSAISGEVGLRGDHFYLWNKDYELNTYPVASPRFNVSWVPGIRNDWLDKLTLTAGTGMFSMFSTNTLAADEKYGVKSFSVSPDRALFQVLGGEADFAGGWSFKLEGYYKYYFNRLYITGDYDPATLQVKYGAHTDGEGFATGFDFMLRKKDGRKLDGYLTYSFVVAKYRNPTEPAEKDGTDLSGNPLGIWYYPSFHRFHTLNLVMNWKPFTGLTFTTSVAVASGNPLEKQGAIEMYPVLYKGKVIEQYRKTSVYDADNRTDISCPVDVRLGYSNYYKNSKVKWEYYVGVEDVFVNLYSPSGNKGFNEFTGEESEASDDADFNIGIPMFSIGYKVSY